MKRWSSNIGGDVQRRQACFHCLFALPDIWNWGQQRLKLICRWAHNRTKFSVFWSASHFCKLRKSQINLLFTCIKRSWYTAQRDSIYFHLLKIIFHIILWSRNNWIYNRVIELIILFELVIMAKCNFKSCNAYQHAWK